jgi:hypothetical protein
MNRIILASAIVRDLIAVGFPVIGMEYMKDEQLTIRFDRPTTAPDILMKASHATEMSHIKIEDNGYTAKVMF